MKIEITIAQVEIEEAIKARVLDQISPKDGQEINIELRATRGPEGFTAVISIDDSNLSAVNKAAPAPKKIITTSDLKRMQAEEAAAEAEAEAAAGESTEGTTDNGSDGSEAGESEPEAQPEPVVTPATVAAGPAPVKKRLFGGVVKPSNAAA